MSLLTNLLAWWGLHDTNWLDDSGNGNTLTLVGSVTSVAGLIGNAASFPGGGTNYLALGSGIITSSPFSAACWIKPTSLAGTQVPFDQFSGTERQGFSLAADGTPTFYSGFNQNTSGSAGQVVNGVWQHLCQTYDGTTLKGYVNGVLVASAAKTFSAGSSVVFGQLRIGATTSPYTGLTTMAGMWSRALTDGSVSVGQTAGGEVAQLYNLGIGLDYPFSSGGLLMKRRRLAS